MYWKNFKENWWAEEPCCYKKNVVQSKPVIFGPEECIRSIEMLKKKYKTLICDEKNGTIVCQTCVKATNGTLGKKYRFRHIGLRFLQLLKCNTQKS